MSKSEHKFIIGGIVFTKDYLMVANDFLGRKIYYRDIKKYYIKKNVHARFITKDIVLVTANDKKRKISYAVGTCGIFVPDPEKSILFMMKKVCPKAEYLKKENIKKDFF